MNRTDKNSLIGSALFHGVVIGVLLLSSVGFMASKENEVVDLPVLNTLSPEDLAKLLTDGATSGGPGPVVRPVPAPTPTPAPAPAAEPARPVRQEPVPTQPTPQPERRTAPAPRQPDPEPEPAPKAAPPRETRTPQPKAEIPAARNAPETATKVAPPKKAPTATAKPKEAPKRVISMEKTVKVDGDAAAEARERARLEANRAAAARAEADRRKLLDGIQSGIEKVASDTARGVGSVSFSGGGGGQAAINYGEFIVAEFKRSWIAPNTGSGSLVAKATVTIASDGRVTEARLIGRSGDAAFDKSVEAVLKRVRKVAGFPAGSSTEPRTYTISFKPDSQKGLG